MDFNCQSREKELKNIIKENFKLIDEAIKNRYDMIILSEAQFPVYLNIEPILLERLKNKSKKIIILTGGLRYENKKFYNSSYLFQNGKMQITNKVILVPFGEKIPLPKFIADFLNDIFFEGAEDFIIAEKPIDFLINGYKFRNAICFEATKDELFINNPKFMIAISNNARFQPSIETTLQNQLLKFYARKYKTIIYHSANYGKSEIISY